jgi:glucosamine--fructose-6-phosphate aminotransferase (isomerizing)
MCSVIGYVGHNSSKKFVLEGLGRLEYRGYDSAGFACVDTAQSQVLFAKAIGNLDNLEKQFVARPIDGSLGIGHTRWSTHGKPTLENAHPQFDCFQTIALVHNGIIENHHELRIQLEQTGHTFCSQTDTETIAHLLETVMVAHQTCKAALVDVVKYLQGAYAFLAICQEYPEVLIAVRKRSPLCIGIGDGQMFAASDVLAFADKTKKVLFLPDESFALIRKDRIELYDFSGKPLPLAVQMVDVVSSDMQKQGYEHYMLKEIYEQKDAIYSTVTFLESMGSLVWDHLSLDKQHIDQLNSIDLIACGTSWHASRIAQFFFEEIAGIPTRVHLASEFRYMHFFANPKSIYLFVSQSGETADTLEALSLVNNAGLSTVALTNVASSTMVREAQGFLLTQAGREISVASTKAFTTQIIALYWFAHRIAVERGIINENGLEAAYNDILVAAEVLENTIQNYKNEIIQKLAPLYSSYKKAIFLGRHISYPLALEAALKLKEISYIFAQAYPAGELKHGPLALIDAETPVFLFSHQNPIMYQKLVANAQEIKARNGHLVVFAFDGQQELINLANYAFVIPCIKPLLGPIAMTGLMQFFIYQIAKELGRPIDKPRNLAKSVTVE